MSPAARPPHLRETLEIRLFGARVTAVIRSMFRVLAALITATGIAQAATPPRVLMLFSNDRLLPANQRVDEGIRRALDPKGNQSGVTFFAEFLDVIRLGGMERERVMEEYLQKRYRETPPDVLIALGPEALSFLLTRRNSLFPDTPIVFGGIGIDQLQPVEGKPGITGVPMEITVVPVVGSLLAMRPRTREIVLIHGSSESDRKWRDVALCQCATFAGRVKITDSPELPLEELKSCLAALSSETAVVYLTYFQSPTGETYTPARVAREIAAASAVPVMGPYDTYIGTGVLGVSVSPFDDEGIAVGTLTRRVLSGEKAESIGVLPPNPARLILDERQMKRWGITSVPAGADLRFHTPTLWEDHRGLIIGAAVVFALQAGLIVALLVQQAWWRRSEREAVELRRELTHLSRLTMLSTLSGSLAHELNQPLGSILSNAQAAEMLLEQDPPDLAEVRSILADIVKADHRAGEVIKRLRAFLKRGELNRQPHSMNGIVEETLQLERSDLVTRGVTVECALTPGLPLVRCDRVQIQQVILNLLVNACDAMAGNEPDARQMTIQSSDGHGRVRISVRDTGCGLPEDVEGIFQPFVTTKGHGLGLGLAISRSIIESHGGRLWAEAQDTGAVFHLDLPVGEEMS